MRNLAILLVAACCAFACDAPEGDLGLAAKQVALTTAQTPAGFVDFFSGEAVMDEVARTGTFVPSLAKRYSMIRVPSWMIDVARSDNPVTVSICDEKLGILVQTNSLGNGYKADDGRNCTPWIVHGNGSSTTTLVSGQPGLMGAVQVIRDSKGNVGAQAQIGGSLPIGLVCPEMSEATADIGMTLGILDDDGEPDDPLLATCAPSKTP
jgi:hypothetical protein